MEYFLGNFEEFNKICGKGKLSKSFALKLLYRYGDFILKYPDSFEFYKEKPSEQGNTYENFLYENYGNIHDMDIIEGLIIFGYDFSKIKELNKVVGKIFEGESCENILQNKYIRHLHFMYKTNTGGDYAKDKRDKLIRDYKKYFSKVHEFIENGVCAVFNSGSEDYNKFLNAFEIFDQDILRVLLNNGCGVEYINKAFKSGDEGMIKKFKFLDDLLEKIKTKRRLMDHSWNEELF